MLCFLSVVQADKGEALIPGRRGSIRKKASAEMRLRRSYSYRSTVSASKQCESKEKKVRRPLK
jgi:hypothetical protein